MRVLLLLIRQLFTKVCEGNLNAIIIEFLILGPELIAATGAANKKLADRCHRRMGRRVRPCCTAGPQARRDPNRQNSDTAGLPVFLPPAHCEYVASPSALSGQEYACNIISLCHRYAGMLSFRRVRRAVHTRFERHYARIVLETAFWPLQ